MKTKITLILTVIMLIVPCIAVLTPETKALSNETTGVNSFMGADTSQNTYQNLGGYDIFAIDNKIVFYNDQTGVLVKTYDIVLYGQAASFGEEMWPRVAIEPINSSALVVVHSYMRKTSTSAVNYQFALLDINTLNYQVLRTSTENLQGTGSTFNSSIWTYGNALMLFNYDGGNGTKYYYAMFGAMVHRLTGVNEMNYYNGLHKIGSMSNNSMPFESGYSQIQETSGTTNTPLLYTSCYYFQSGTDIYYTTSSGFLGTSDLRVYKMTFNPVFVSLTYLGLSGVGNPYAANYVYSNTVYVGFVHVFGHTFNAATGCYLLSIAYSPGIPKAIGATTLKFNDTFVSAASPQIIQALNTDNYYVRPFALQMPSNINVSDIHNGLYGYSIWCNTYTPEGLTGISYDVTGLDTGFPVWTLHEMLFLWTPQNPKVHYYGNAGGYTNFAGWQPIGSLNGIMTDINGGRFIGDTFYVINAAIYFETRLYGDIFSAATIASYPTEVKLKQSYPGYYFKCYVFMNGLQSGNGTFTLKSTGLSISSLIASAGNYTDTATGAIVNGYFTFAMASRSSSQSVVYEGFKINVVVDAENITNSYLFGWYALGGSDGSGSVPYPTIPGGQPISSAGVIDSVGYSNFLTGFVGFMLLFILVGAPALILGAKAGLPGLIVGGVLGLGIGVAAGLIAWWFIFLIASGVAVAFIMYRRNDGQG